MPEKNDMALIREFADRGSEAAFADLVQRHIHLVHSVGLRYTGNPSDAQDITQAVFIVLARKAASLRNRTTLTGWLYETTRLSAAAFLRTRARRQAREQEAYMQSTLNETDPNRVWRQLAPILEEAMGRLSETERALLALRLFENKTAAETASLLGIREGAAHKRMARALDKLRRFFLKRGIDSTALIIAGAISANSVQAAPAALANSVTAAATAKGALAGASTLTVVKGALKLMAWTKAQTAIVGAVVVGMAVLSVVQHQIQTELRGENDSLRRQITQLQSDNEGLSKKASQAERMARLSAPPAHFAAPPAAPPAEPGSNDPRPSGVIAKLFNGGDAPRLTHEQVEAYLKANGRSAENLLAAFDASGDPALLLEAREKYPNDPQVDFRAALDKNLTPDQQRQWLNAFEQSAPNNALANYLSAMDYFSSGHNDQAVQELNAAAEKSQFQDYTLDSMQSREDAYLAAGYSAADAAMIAESQTLLPQVAALKQLGQNMVGLANSYQQSGDPTSAQAALQMAANLGRSLDDDGSGAPFLINTLAGMNIERNALSAMDPNSAYGSGGQTVQDQLNQLAQRKTELKTLNDQFNNSAAPVMSQQDWISYQQRQNIFGEAAADQWAISKYGRQ